MKRSLLKIGFIGLMVVIAAASLSLSTQTTEKKKIKGTGKTTRIVSSNPVFLKDVPGHMIYKDIRVGTITSSDPDWNNIQILEWEQGDGIPASGSHKGYDIEIHTNGDESYIKYEGTHKMVKEGKEGADWEVAGEGKYVYMGGTGKFKNTGGNRLELGNGSGILMGDMKTQR
jgi:hypothetical protein